MSLGFDDKVLGEKVHYYCDSGSEHNDSAESDIENSDKEENALPKPEEDKFPTRNQGPQTGPKGVKADYEFYKRLEYEKKLLENEEFIRKTLEKAMISRTLREDLQETEKAKYDQEEDDEFLKEYRRKRLEQMQNLYSGPTFGTYICLNKNNFVEEIDNESPNTVIVIHISLGGNEFCKRIDDYLIKLSKCYSRVKFCHFNALTEGMSLNFVRDGIPSIIAYKNRNLISNLVRIDKILDRNFGLGDLENCLIENNILTGENSSTTAVSSRISERHESNSSEDED